MPLQLYSVVVDVDKYAEFLPFCVYVPRVSLYAAEGDNSGRLPLPQSLCVSVSTDWNYPLTRTHARALLVNSPLSSGSRVTRRMSPRAFEAELSVGFQLLRYAQQLACMPPR